jgi:hypothetical protein
LLSIGCKVGLLELWTVLLNIRYWPCTPKA